ncbi:MAG: hypothetical protein IJ484_07695 [Oscillospiraceae bacterium]|nr:hypothetical protein [Oscillospiraceae bacterium]
MENHSSPSFEYTYSAPQQEEIRRIRAKYQRPAEQVNKLEELRRLDRSAERPGQVAAITLGILGCLMLGTGLSCATVPEFSAFFYPGIALGVAGLLPMALAYPVYRAITRRQREKIAPRILQLTEELTE